MGFPWLYDGGGVCVPAQTRTIQDQHNHSTSHYIQ